ncbi:MAG: protein-export chaperone SecB [Bacteroidales bacterium]|nr:protein-export chaperone SecB [Bacteroidales bacterium]MBQ8231078.1 protein-export chaperone SecB [Lachnospiraceae bacterium]
MNNSECKIQMLDLFFSKYSFAQERRDDNKEYNSSFTINYAINNDDDSKIKVIIDTSVTNNTGSISLELQTVGMFKIDKMDLEQNIYEHLVKVNTVAIIFPFIRSQISLLTTQPGMTPIMLPPMNLNALIDSQEN